MQSSPRTCNSPHSHSISRFRLRRIRATALCALPLLFLAVFLAVPASSTAADKAPTSRSVEGRVLNNANDAPLAGAIVSIRDMNTMKVISLFVDDKGGFTYEELSPTVDYRIWAVYQGKKSPEKLLSQYETKNVFHVRLRIDLNSNGVAK